MEQHLDESIRENRAAEEGSCCGDGSCGVSKKPCLGRIALVSSIILVSFISGTLGAVYAPAFLAKTDLPFLSDSAGSRETPVETRIIQERIIQEDSLIVDIVEKASPAVVSIVATKDVPRVRSSNPFEGLPFFFLDPLQYDGEENGAEEGETERQRIGSGTGFFVSQDGLIVTNKHVVSDEAADYTVLLDGGKEYAATVLARDPIHDLAIIKVDGSGFTTLELGDSDTLKAGQTVIAIGNSLGEFANSVSKGIISGLGRNLTAGSGFGDEEQLTDIIQTDAAINPGNSGGPLLDVSGKIIGVNVAVARAAENVGFALPSNQLKRIVEDVKATGKISSAYMGVRYSILDKQAQEDNSLPFDYGAIVLRGTRATEFAVIPGSPADKAGIVENDIILEIDGQRIDTEHPLGNVLAKYRPGDTVTVKLWHKGETKDVTVVLEERK